MTTVETRAGSVLIVDADPATRSHAKIALEQGGLTVADAGNRSEGIRLAIKLRPDLILLDAGLPELNGFETCRHIRRTAALADTPVIMLTSYEDDDLIELAYDSGATDFVRKPIRWPLLAHRVRYVLRGIRESRVLAESKNKNRAFINAIPDFMIVVDRDGSICSYQRGKDGNAVFDRQLRVGRSVLDCLPPEFAASWSASIRHVLDKRVIQQFESSVPQGNSTAYFDVRMVPFTTEQILVILRDVSVQKKADAKVRRLAFFDSLTGLPNRQSFLIQLADIIRQCKNTDRQFSILYVDLDNFKRVNETLGHTVGDALLKATATRIEGCVRKQDHVSRLDPIRPEMHVARLGGDEFTLLLRDVQSSEDAEAVAARIAEALRKPLEHAGQEFVITPSIGIATYPEDGEDIDTLVANANMAMTHSKESGRDRFTQFSGTMSVRSLERLDLEDSLRRAIRENALKLHYQPKLCLKTQRITGAEALLRWTHPERGAVPPAKFIPIAEESGLINDIGDWVLNAACDQLVAWQKSESLRGKRLAINLSGKQFIASNIDKRIVEAV
ncbi:MAG: diguanylate cyclase, partial [Pseudomonadota bacterium]